MKNKCDKELILSRQVRELGTTHSKGRYWFCACSI